MPAAARSPSRSRRRVPEPAAPPPPPPLADPTPTPPPPLLRRWLRTAARLDAALSLPMHGSRSRAAELMLLLPACLFQPAAVPLWLTAAFVLAPARAFVELAAGTALTLGATSVCKARVGRQRPDPLTLATRRCNLRSLERNHAMPSGDAAQAALWALLLALACDCPALLLAPALTCAGRVLYGCHWWGDVLVGALVGAAVGVGVHAAVGAGCRAAPGGLAGAVC